MKETSKRKLKTALSVSWSKIQHQMRLYRISYSRSASDQSWTLSAATDRLQVTSSTLASWSRCAIAVSMKHLQDTWPPTINNSRPRLRNLTTWLIRLTMPEIGRRSRRRSWCLSRTTILKYSKSRQPLVLLTHCTIYASRSLKCFQKSQKSCKRHLILKCTWSKLLKRNLRRLWTKSWGITIPTRWFHLLTIKLVHSRLEWATSGQIWETVSPNFSIKIIRRFRRH